MKLLPFLFVCNFLCYSNLFSNTKEIDTIKWNPIDSISNKEDKLLFIDMYTDWCGWCKEMDRTTYKNEKLVQYLNKNYYSLKFDAQQKGDIFFDNKKYTFLNEYNMHELALQFSNGRPSFPLSVIIDPKNHKVYPFPGYRSAKDFEIILKFFAENKEITKENFDNFRRKFKEEWQ